MTRYTILCLSQAIVLIASLYAVWRWYRAEMRLEELDDDVELHEAKLRLRVAQSRRELRTTSRVLRRTLNREFSRLDLNESDNPDLDDRHRQS